MKLKRKEGFFSISAVAKMFSVHQQTIRLYEKQGLITPARSTGNTRLFSEEDIDKLEEIIHLTHNLGINLAGVEMILKLKKQIKKMQKDMNKVFHETQQQLDKETESAQASITSNVKRLMAIKKEQAHNQTFISGLPQESTDAIKQPAQSEHEVEYQASKPALSQENAKKHEKKMPQSFDEDNWHIDYEQ